MNNVKTLQIPDHAVAYILMQRTGLQRFNPRAYRGLRRLPIPYEHHLLPLEAQLRRGAIKAAFSASILQDYNAIRAYLPAKAGTVLDVGCGIAGIDALLSRIYDDAHFYLLDRTETDTTGFEYGMGDQYRFYNSLELAKAVMLANGTAEAQVHLLDAQPGFRFDPSHRFDLVLSLISWGYHYPVATYLDQVYDAMAPGARLLLDIRKGYGGETQLEARFGAVHILSQTAKEMRCMVAK